MNAVPCPTADGSCRLPHPSSGLQRYGHPPSPHPGVCALRVVTWEHILAGYGDSSGHPSESGFTTDVLALYDWAKARSGNSSIIFWGHSLGTG